MNLTELKTVLADNDGNALRAFVDAVRRPDVARAARDLAEAHRAAAAALEPVALIANSFQVGQSPDELLGILRRATSKVRDAASRSRAEIIAMSEFAEQHRAKHSEALRAAASASLTLEAETIPRLEKQISQYNKARESRREQLAAVGIPDCDIDRAALLRPNQADLDGWRAEAREARARVERLRAFTASGPMYDASRLQDGDLNFVV